MSKNFKQYDSRWGSIGYPYKPYTVRGSGCGPTAVADIVCNNPDYTTITPKQVAVYMRKKGYAIAGQGTTWDGITKTLKHYGFKVKRPDTVSEFMKIVGYKNGKKGILLVNSNTAPDGTKWTSGGHYVACVGTKKKGKKKLFQIYDPGARNHNGWFNYDKSMKGCINQFWTAQLKKYKVPNVDLKKGSKNKKAVRWLQACLNKIMKSGLKIDGIFGDGTFKELKKFQEKYKLKNDGIFRAEVRKKMIELINK